MPSGSEQVQQSTHPKNAIQPRHLCNGPVANFSGGLSAAPLHDSRNNAQTNYNQQVFGAIGATSQVPAPANQIDSRYLYLNSQYSVQNAFGGQNYVLVGGGPGIRAPAPNFNNCYPVQSMMQQQPSIMTQVSSPMTYLPQPNQMMTIANGSQSNGQGLLPLPYPFQNKPVQQNFQPPPFPHQVSITPFQLSSRTYRS